MVFFWARLLTALVGLADPLGNHWLESCLLSGSKRGTQVSSPVTILSRNLSSCLYSRKFISHKSFQNLACSGVSWWGMNLAHSLLIFKSTFNTLWTEETCSPVFEAKSEMVTRPSSWTNLRISSTCAALFLGLPERALSFTGVVWSLAENLLHHMQTWVFDRERSPKVSLRALQISIGFDPRATIKRMLVLWSSLDWWLAIKKLRILTRRQRIDRSIGRATSTNRTDNCRDPISEDRRSQTANVEIDLHTWEEEVGLQVPHTKVSEVSDPENRLFLKKNGLFWRPSRIDQLITRLIWTVSNNKNEFSTSVHPVEAHWIPIKLQP